jgi:ssDNA thymidine ADP-ribosyltransferase, DarT
MSPLISHCRRSQNVQYCSLIMHTPARPKIYHIVHVDRLASIIGDGWLWSDAEIVATQRPGTTIGMSGIKARRLNELQLSSHPGLYVGQCVPFYFCPRSIMLYLIHRANHEELSYRGGQGPIVHLESDLRATVGWAAQNRLRWAFTLSNAGARYFEDRSDLNDLGEVNWEAVTTNRWSGLNISRQVKEGKQAEFLVERCFPWTLVERVGLHSRGVAQQVADAMGAAAHRPIIEIRTDWYY